MGFSDIVPTLGIIRVLVIIIAIMRIVLTGIIVTIAIEAAKIKVENDISIQEYRQAVRESTQRRVVRERKRGSRRLEEGG